MFGLSPLEMFAALVVAHMLCDYPLQGDFLAKAKNHTAPLPGVPWWQALGAHSVIHGGAVWLITGVWWLGLAEVVAHAVTDFAKCNRHFGFTVDQFLHIVFKAVWVGFAIPWETGGMIMAVLFGLSVIVATFLIPPGERPAQ